MRILQIGWMKPALAVIALATVSSDCSSRGVTFTIRNVGNTPLAGVVVRVTGNSYSIGDVLVNQTRSVVVKPSGESHIEIEQAGHQPLVVDCYFEPGYAGDVSADVTTDKVVSVKNNIRI